MLMTAFSRPIDGSWPKDHNDRHIRLYATVYILRSGNRDNTGCVHVNLSSKKVGRILLNAFSVTCLDSTLHILVAGVFDSHSRIQINIPPYILRILIPCSHSI
jgi:hypothetical protein